MALKGQRSTLHDTLYDNGRDMRVLVATEGQNIELDIAE